MNTAEQLPYKLAEKNHLTEESKYR